MGAGVETRSVGPAELPELARLFDAHRNTRHCWCMAFCTTRARFAVGWVTGGNRGEFEAMAAADSTPLGVMAVMAGEPVGWAACGPRSRYSSSGGPQRTLLVNRARKEDETVWLVPCLFVSGAHRGEGITYALVRAAVDVARAAGALAIEGWPLTSSDRQAANAFVGRERVFEDVGFVAVDHPAPDRVIMRRNLRH